MAPSAPRTARRGALLLSYSHATVDFYQGAVAALVPFLVVERGYSYAAAAGIVLAGSFASSIVQPLFGAFVDKWRMRWLVPVAIIFGGAGIAVIAYIDSLPATAIVTAISGIGVAAFHPAGAHRARELSGDDHVVMSWFSLGGGIGFVAAPLTVAATVGVMGLAGTPFLMIPAITGVIAVLLAARVKATGHTESVARARAHGRDNWRAFTLMSAAIVLRSIVFVGTGAFLVLFMSQYRGFDEFASSAALFVFYLGGTVGTAIGGHLARCWPRTSIVRWSYLLGTPVLLGVFLVRGPLVFVFIALATIVLYVPFSLHVSLGQDYLPRHMGTASGVTLGLAVSVGGIAAPVIGAIADHIGLETALLPLAALPILAFLVVLPLRDPHSFTATAVAGEEAVFASPAHPD